MANCIHRHGVGLGHHPKVGWLLIRGQNARQEWGMELWDRTQQQFRETKSRRSELSGATATNPVTGQPDVYYKVNIKLVDLQLNPKAQSIKIKPGNSLNER
jgi:hypothetical protein